LNLSGCVTALSLAMNQSSRSTAKPSRSAALRATIYSSWRRDPLLTRRVHSVHPFHTLRLLCGRVPALHRFQPLLHVFYNFNRYIERG
jgi:hypothetical protein